MIRLCHKRYFKTFEKGLNDGYGTPYPDTPFRGVTRIAEVAQTGQRRQLEGLVS
jgi:hypothetical protein